MTTARVHNKPHADGMFVFVIVLIVVALGVGAVYIDTILPSPSLPVASAKVDASLARIPFGENPNASVHMVIFGDYECPNTQVDWEMIKSIRADYGDRVNIAWVHTPLDIHPRAVPAARAVVCAQMQGREKFWQMSEEIFTNQQSLDDASLVTYASQIGLDVGEFSRCVQSEESQNMVRDDLIFAVSHGVKGTPTYVIDGRWFEGVQEEGFLRGLLDSALEAKQ